LLIGLAAAGLLVCALVPRVAQDPAYHRFADGRRMCGVPYCNDVLSNAPLVVVGLCGLAVLRRRPAAARPGPERAAWTVAFLGVALTGFGSAYYHWNPTNATLAWDRLPMTVVFAGLVAAQLAERLGPAVGRVALPSLLLFCPATVAYWAWTESRGVGDLRWYAYAQFFPLLFVPALWATSPRRYDRTGDLVAAAVWYAVAKAAEALDRPIYDALGGFLSGHTLKHVAAAVATACFVRHVARRAPVG
jgi:hypothetical protein